MIATALRTLLLNQVVITSKTNRISVNHAQQGTVAPYIVISVIDHDPYKCLDGTTGLQTTDVDIDCVAKDYPAAKGLADAVSLFLKDYTGTVSGNETINAVLYNGQDEDVVFFGDGRDGGFHFVTLEFQIQHTPV